MTNPIYRESALPQVPYVEMSPLSLSTALVEETQNYALKLTAKLAQEEPDPLSTNIRRTAGQINQFLNSSYSDQSARLMQNAGTNVLGRLQASSQYAEERKQIAFQQRLQAEANRYELKNTILSSSLPKATSFSERRTVYFPSIPDIEMDENKTNNSISEYIGKKVEIQVVDKVTKVIITNCGKLPSLVFKVGAKVVLKSTDEQSEEVDNANRDLVISTASGVGVSEVLAFGFKQLPVGKAIFAAEIAKEMAIVGQECMSKTQQNEEINNFWNENAMINDNPRFETTCFLAQGILEACKFPGDAVDAAKDFVAETAIAVADHLGVTEKNITPYLEKRGENMHFELDYLYLMK